ncbi:MAG: hypothetical protein Q9200_007333, partial [Gallowayella weberi]
MSPVGVEKMWEVPMAHENHVSPAGRKRLMDRSRDFHRLQLFPGRQLDDLNAGFITRIEHGTTWNNIPQPCILSSTADEMVVSLYKWCGYVLVDAASRGFYGDALVDTSPQIVRDFLEFDKQSWMLFYQYPSFLAKAMTAPRERITQAFDRYIALHSEKKKDAAPYTKALAAEQTDAGISTRDGAIAFQIFHFGYTLLTALPLKFVSRTDPVPSTNANAYKVCFWLLAHILYDPSLLSAIRKETAPAVEGGKVDINLLVDETTCPTLNAAFNETLRYTGAVTSSRTVLSQTTIGGKTLYPGVRVLLPSRPGHFEESVFGSNSLEFDPQRFLKEKNLTKTPLFRPFGGGAQYCSGRYLARREIVGFIAFVLNRFEIGLSNAGQRSGRSTPQRSPRLDVNTPNLGIIPPMLDDDIR